MLGFSPQPASTVTIIVRIKANTISLFHRTSFLNFIFSVLLYIITNIIIKPTNIRVDNAFMTGFIPLLVMENISMLKFDTPLPVLKKDITKSSTDRVKAIKAPVIMPGLISGITTFLKA